MAESSCFKGCFEAPMNVTNSNSCNNWFTCCVKFTNGPSAEDWERKEELKESGKREKDRREIVIENEREPPFLADLPSSAQLPSRPYSLSFDSIDSIESDPTVTTINDLTRVLSTTNIISKRSRGKREIKSLKSRNEGLIDSGQDEPAPGGPLSLRE